MASISTSGTFGIDNQPRSLEARFQRLFCRDLIPGALPQAGGEYDAPLAPSALLRTTRFTLGRPLRKNRKNFP
jgi:hypothetical protein